MKKLFLTGVSLLCALTLTFAQSNPEEAAKQETATLTTALTLTEDQSAEILPILVDGNKAKEAIKSDATLSPELLSEALNKQQSTTDAQVAEALTEEQKPLFESYISQRPKEQMPTPTVEPGTQPVEPAQPMQQPMEPTQQPAQPMQP
ncbi:MAG: hypothetical protein ACTJHT_07715 [Sphingobacterium sp.]|uniref:hypothetical protein n=1 Tax=Sphingobacterium sp. JB170 TaxID=1434842 RepID=UPI00097E810C|nr:hypothetical protein [Sphingobacterium sp. JB170]SJN21623.1 hypothetical protein FM107_02925 [Sphingobacterium sp. JB170]